MTFCCEMSCLSYLWLTRKKITVVHSLTKPTDGWVGERGRPTLDMLKKCLPVPDSEAMVLVCGTDAFVASLAGPLQRTVTPEGKKKKVQGPLSGLLAELGYTESM